MRVTVWTKSNHSIRGAYFAVLLRTLGYRAITHIVPEQGPLGDLPYAR